MVKHILCEFEFYMFHNKNAIGEEGNGNLRYQFRISGI